MLRTVLAPLMFFACSGLALAQPPLVAQAPVSGDEAAGEELFLNECSACHGGLIAPNLRGVAGRKIASVETFQGYSDGLKTRAGEAWTDKNLAAFLAAPAEFAPGTFMTKSLPDERSRGDMVAFLKSLPPPR